MHKKEYIPRRKPLGFDTSSLMMLSRGNPGALSCLTDLYHRHPHQPFEVEQVLIMFDDLGLYREKLYRLWNDCLNRNTDRLIRLAALRHDGWISDSQILSYLTHSVGEPIPEKIIGKGGIECQI